MLDIKWCTTLLVSKTSVRSSRVDTKLFSNRRLVKLNSTIADIWNREYFCGQNALENLLGNYYGLSVRGELYFAK